MSGSDCEESDIEKEHVVEHDDFESDDAFDDSEMHTQQSWTGKDGTQWTDPCPTQRQTISRNILRGKGGAPSFNRLYTARDIFQSIISPEMCILILKCTNQKGRKVTDEWNKKTATKYQPPNRPTTKFISFTEEELHAFFGILIAAGVHRSNKEHVSESCCYASRSVQNVTQIYWY